LDNLLVSHIRLRSLNEPQLHGATHSASIFLFQYSFFIPLGYSWSGLVVENIRYLAVLFCWDLLGEIWKGKGGMLGAALSSYDLYT
jgi:hypothetical protein